MTTGTNVGYLGPIVSDFLEAAYPDVRVEMHCTGRVVDLIEERFDLGVRAGTLSDSTLIARTLGSAKWFLVATSAYLKRRGRPKSPGGLERRTTACSSPLAPAGPAIRLENGDQSVQVPVTPRLLVSDLDVLDAGASAGLGIALLPAFHCVEGLRARRLERVLGDWSVPATPIHVVYPSSRHASPKVSRFVEHLHERMTPPPWEARAGPLDPCRSSATGRQCRTQSVTRTPRRIFLRHSRVSGRGSAPAMERESPCNPSSRRSSCSRS